jgi:outer membrane protein assembly factor BamE (lipoprotein component of BamABCDE complex)
MKKIIILTCCLLVIVVSFTSCAKFFSDLFTTSDYKLFRNFSQNYKVGMDKQDVFKKLGYPESSTDVDGNTQNYKYGDKEAFEEIIMSSNSVEWRYTCHEYSDPANPYSLTVYFDSEGKCTNVEFEPIPGG